MTATRGSSLGRSYALTMLGSVGFLVFTLYTGVLTARLLAPDGRGVVGAIAAWAMMASFIGGLGLREGMSWMEVRDERSAPSVLTSTLLATFLLATVTLGVSQLLIPIGFRAQTDTVVTYARFAMLWVLPYMAFNALGSLLGARHRFGAVTLMRVGQPLLFAVALTAAWLTDRATVVMVLVLQVASFAIPSAIALAALAAESGFGRFDRDLTSRAATYGLRAFGSTFGALANARLDLMVLPAVIAASEIGIYVVAVSAATMIVGLFGSLHLVVFPAAARAGGQEAVALAQRAVRVVLIASVSVAVAIGVLAPWLVRLLYGAEFMGAVTPLRLLLPGVCCWAVVAIVEGALKGIGRPAAASIAQGVGLVVTVVGLALLIPRWGITGAAIASTMAYATVLVCAMAMFVRATDTSIAALLGPSALVAEIRWFAGRLRTIANSRRDRREEMDT